MSRPRRDPAVRHARRLPTLWVALLGLAFNVKMLAALVCGPALLAGWWLAGELDLRRRLGWMAVAAATLAIASLSWAVAFDLTPKDKRPYAGSTQHNSMLELVIVHNGLDRFVRPRAGAPISANAFASSVNCTGGSPMTSSLVICKRPMRCKRSVR